MSVKFRIASHLTHLTEFSDKIVRLLGQGTFGKVVEAYDKHKGLSYESYRHLLRMTGITGISVSTSDSASTLETTFA
jgi:aspartokinase-like uncharacterized kinase